MHQLMPKRLNRKGYWIRLAIYLLFYSVLYFVFLRVPTALQAVSAILPAIWMLFIAAPRLRDFGQTGWWSISLLVLGFLTGFANGMHLFGEPSNYAMAQAGLGLLTIVFMIVVGSVPGSKGANRFGDGPGANQAEVFS